jgi:DNA-binding beta-propeller fold protein YncE
LPTRLEQFADALTGRRCVLPLLVGLPACLLLLGCLTSSALAGGRVYWANDGSTTSRISFANLDGSGGGDLAGATGGAPRGVAIDVAAGKVYWTKPGNTATDGRISFANLDGSGGGGGYLDTTGATVNHPNAAAIYPAAGRIYWANEWGDRISFANLDNTGGGDLIVIGATVEEPIAPMVDPGSGRIYWANANPINVISFASLDGSGSGDLNTGDATVANPHGLALDPVAGRIYWANVGVGTRRTGQGISYTSLDGSGGGNLNTAGATVNAPVGVAIDPAARRIYWANQAGNEISFADLDGGGGGDLRTPGATLKGSRSPVLLTAPSGARRPKLTGGSKTGSVLACSRGSWARDLLGSWLYRAPRSFTYSWTRNRARIAGARGNSYRASARGNYRCKVTASNLAGSSSQTSPAHAVRRRAFGVEARMSMTVATRRIAGNGPLAVVVGNRNGFKVSGRLSALANERVSDLPRRRLATRPKGFVVGADARKTVTLKLSKPLERLLRRDRKLSLLLVLKVRDPARDTRTLMKRVSLRLKRG